MRKWFNKWAARKAFNALYFFCTRVNLSKDDARAIDALDMLRKHI